MRNFSNEPWPIVAVQMAALAAHAPLLWLAANTLFRPNLGTAGLLILSIWTVSMGLVVLLHKLGTARPTALAMVSILVLAFWHWESLRLPIGGLPVWLTTTVLVGLLLGAAISMASGRLFQLALFVASLTFAVVAATQFLSNNSFRGVSQIASTGTTLSAEPGVDLPNIVVVIFDAYARADVLSTDYDLDNTNFLAGLVEQGFVVAERATTNYTVTHLSVSSLLDLEYPLGEGGSLSPADILALQQMISGDNATVNSLKALGYSYVLGPSGFWGTVCTEDVDFCWKTDAGDQTGFELLQGTPFGSFGAESRVHPNARIALERLQQFRDWETTTEAWPEQPWIVLVHMPVPHAPLHLDEDCRVNTESYRLGEAMSSDPDSPADQLARRRNAYVGQLLCTNTIAQEIVDALDPSDVILLLSDHGPDSRAQSAQPPSSWTQEALVERISILAAARLPEPCREAFHNDISTVNILRVAAGCSLGAGLSELPSRYFIADHPYEPIVEVADPDP